MPDMEPPRGGIVRPGPARRQRARAPEPFDVSPFQPRSSAFAGGGKTHLALSLSTAVSAFAARNARASGDAAVARAGPEAKWRRHIGSSGAGGARHRVPGPRSAAVKPSVMGIYETAVRAVMRLVGCRERDLRDDLQRWQSR